MSQLQEAGLKLNMLQWDLSGRYIRGGSDFTDSIGSGVHLTSETRYSLKATAWKNIIGCYSDDL